MRLNDKVFYDHGIHVVKDVASLERINHDYKLTMNAYMPVMLRMHSYNKFITRLMNKMSRPKNQKSKIASMVIKRVFKYQIEGLTFAADRLKKLQS